MSEVSEVFTCSEAQNGHAFPKRQALALLQKNSDSGCQICTLLVDALEGFHGPWISEQAETLHVSLLRSINRSLTITLHLDGCTNIPGGYEREAASFGQLVLTEVVCKPSEIAPAKIVENIKHGAEPLGGKYDKLGIRAGRDLPDNPCLNFDLVQSWIKDCIRNHPQCQTKSRLSLPKRVVAVGTIARPSLYLYESNNEEVEYATLSHRWGADRLLTTTTDTLNDRKKKIELLTLSKTFQESIIVTRLLGLRYLWIDSLCIIQDDTNDWQVESSKMAAIYEGAHITIAANKTSSDLLGGSELRSTRSVNMQVQAIDGQPTNLLLRSPILHENFYAASLEGGMTPEEDYPLLQRAWCFQERLLATRVLQFTDTEVVFECKTGQQRECGSINHAITTPIKSFFGKILKEDFESVGVAEDTWEGWTMVLRPYVTKDLTVSTDILPALSGVAARMQCSELGRYIAGLWEAKLATGLFWFAEILDVKRSPVQTAPSFSWAALAGRTKVKELTWPYMKSHDNSKQTFEIIDIDCSVDGLNPYGTVSSACVKLHGFATVVTLRAGSTFRGRNGWLKSSIREEPVMVFMDNYPTNRLNMNDKFTCFFGFTWSEDDHTKRPPATRWCVSALLLRLLSEPNVYQRVGCIPQLNNNPGWLDDARVLDLVIV